MLQILFIGLKFHLLPMMFVNNPMAVPVRQLFVYFFVSIHNFLPTYYLYIHFFSHWFYDLWRLSWRRQRFLPGRFWRAICMSKWKQCHFDRSCKFWIWMCLSWILWSLCQSYQDLGLDSCQYWRNFSYYKISRNKILKKLIYCLIFLGIITSTKSTKQLCKFSLERRHLLWWWK